jgi:hypothetical protein
MVNATLKAHSSDVVNRRTGLDLFVSCNAKYYATMEAGFQCAGCGEWNETAVDESAGGRQSYVEDCQICCRPNVLQVEYDLALGEYFISAELESS